MTETREAREPPRSQYPPPDNPNQGGYYPQGSPARDERQSAYPPPDPARQGQYPHPAPYPPPAAWAGQHHSAPYPPYDPHAPGGYPYPPPTSGPPAQLHPDPNRVYLPYPPPHPGYYYPPPPQQPAPRQRTAIACKYCRKRKIRCSGYDSSPDGRCQNCVRFNQQCLFHPVSSQAAFVPASAVYGPATRAPQGGQGDRANGNGQDPPPMLYGAHGQPLGPAGQGHPSYAYPTPPQGYYAYPPPGAHPPPAHGSGAPYDPHAAAPAAQGDSVSNRKRPPPDDDSRDEDTHSSQSPHPNSRPRHNNYEARNNSTGSYDYPDPTNIAPTSPATSTMSYQSHGPGYHANGAPPPRDNHSPTVASGLTPSSAHGGFNSPRAGPVRDDGKTPPPNSAGSSANGRSNVYDVLSDKGEEKPRAEQRSIEQRARNDNDMLSKLDGKKK